MEKQKATALQQELVQFAKHPVDKPEGLLGR